MSAGVTSRVVDKPGSSDASARARAGMLWFLASEAVFFGLLIYSFVVARSQTQLQPEAGSLLNARMAGVMTLILLASSATLWVARRMMGDRPEVTAGGLLATIVLGGAFLVLQLSEYRSLLGQSLSISSSPFGSHFFILTGFHGIHVAVGLGLLSSSLSLGLVRGGRAASGRLLAATELYWHFVDAIWILIFTIVYMRVGT